MDKATSPIHFMYSPLRSHYIVCCNVDELQLPICLQSAIQMIMSASSSNKGIGLNFPVNVPDSTFLPRFFVDLILFCHVHSLDNETVAYSLGIFFSFNST